MSYVFGLTWRGAAAFGTVVGLVLSVGTLAGTAIGQTVSATAPVAATPSSVSTAGRVAFDFPDAPPPTVEIDLGQGLIGYALGLGDAAVAGFLEGLTENASGDSAENAKFLADQLASAREVGDVAAEMIHEVHVRVWDSVPEESDLGVKMAAYYDEQLRGSGWESTVRVREGDMVARVFLAREAESVRGFFVVVSEGNDLVLVNVTGDLSPDKVHKLTATATRIAVKLGLRHEIDKAIGELKREMAN